MPHVSVIVPVYNVEQYLPRCIDSILNQTFADFELILVDDGSPDNCGAICDEYAAKDSRVRVIHKENEGVSVARNAALDAARGAFVAFCDSDDFWELTLLETVVNAMENQQADCALFGFNTYTDEGMISSHSYIPGCFVFNDDKDILEYMIRIQLTIKHGWEMCFHVFSRDIIEKFQIRCCTTCNNFAEDMGFVCRYMLHSKKLVCVPDCLYNYYLRAGSLMRTNANRERIDDVNEVTCYIGRDFYETIHHPVYRRQFPILHFIIMNYQLQKFCAAGKIDQIPKTVAQIRNIDWWNENCKKLVHCHKDLRSYYNLYAANSAVLFAAYLRHGNWMGYCVVKKLFRLPKEILYRVIGNDSYEKIRRRLRAIRKGK